MVDDVEAVLLLLLYAFDTKIVNMDSAFHTLNYIHYNNEVDSYSNISDHNMMGMVSLNYMNMN